MNAPENLNGFVTLLKNMCNRERFVFDLKDSLGQLEIYSTYVNQGYGKKNISLQIVDCDGTSKPTNKLLDNWSKEYYYQIFELLTQQ